MSTSYFSKHDHDMLLGDIGDETALQRIHKRMTDLNKALHPKLKQDGYGLRPTPVETGGLAQRTNTTPLSAKALTLTYTRSQSEAVTVERIMGREAIHQSYDIDTYLHPVIELRLTPEHFVIELVITPEARHDQQNFVGKLSVAQHRDTFYRLLRELGDGYFLGFWSGMHLDDLHMDTKQLPPAKILFEYLDTFAAGRDYFRLGRWYEPEHADLTDENVQVEVMQRIRELYTIYDFMLWASDNNYHVFYKKAMA